MKPAWETGAGFSALAAASVLALNYPLIALFDRDASVLGIPLPFLHVFVVWGLLITGLVVLVEYGGRKNARRASRRDAGLDSVNGVTTPASGQQISPEG